MKSMRKISAGLLISILTICFSCHVFATSVTPDTVLKILKNKQNSEFSGYIFVDVNSLSNDIYSELEKKLNINNISTSTLESKVVDAVTKRAGVTGLVQFKDRSLKLTYKGLDIISQQTGMKKQVTFDFWAQVKLKTTSQNTKYNLQQGIVKVTYSAATVQKTNKTVNYCVSIFKEGDWFSTYSRSAKIGDKISDEFTINADGKYYIVVSKAKDDPEIKCTGQISQLQWSK